MEHRSSIFKSLRTIWRLAWTLVFTDCCLRHAHGCRYCCLGHAPDELSDSIGFQLSGSSKNSRAGSDDSEIFPLLNNDNAQPPQFPVTVRELRALTVHKKCTPYFLWTGAGPADPRDFDKSLHILETHSN